MRHWTPTEENILRREYGITPHDELARKLGRTVEAVRVAASERRISAKQNRWARFGRPNHKLDRHKDKRKHAEDCRLRYHRNKEVQRRASAAYRERNYKRETAA